VTGAFLLDVLFFQLIAAFRNSNKIFLPPSLLSKRINPAVGKQKHLASKDSRRWRLTSSRPGFKSDQPISLVSRYYTIDGIFHNPEPRWKRATVEAGLVPALLYRCAYAYLKL
jgi:hypothetical protein